MTYQISEKDKNSYVGLVLLNEIINFQTYFPVNLTGEDLYLDGYLKELKAKGFLSIKDGKYIPTNDGREEIVNLYTKYDDYLKMFDVFCAVDLEAGEFAFERMFDDTLDGVAWEEHLSNERFSDVRVAVASFKGMNPNDMVFLSFLNENRFDCTIDGWQYDLTSGKPWKEIENICNSAITKEYLEGDGVLLDVITKGSDLALKQFKEAKAIVADEEDEEEYEDEVETTEEVIEYVDVVEMPVYGYDYYDPYYDPYYVSPIWLVPILFL